MAFSGHKPALALSVNYQRLRARTQSAPYPLFSRAGNRLKMHTKALDYATVGVAVARRTGDSARFAAVNDDDNTIDVLNLNVEK